MKLNVGAMVHYISWQAPYPSELRKVRNSEC